MDDVGRLPVDDDESDSPVTSCNVPAMAAKAEEDQCSINGHYVSVLTTITNLLKFQNFQTVKIQLLLIHDRFYH